VSALPGETRGLEATWALDEWRSVVRRIPEAHPFVMPEWQRVWWEHFGTGRLSVLPVPDGAEPVAVVPVHSDDAGVVRFLGGVDVTDYPGPAIAPGHARDAARHVLDRLTADASWAELDVRNARPEDGFVPALAAAAAKAGLRTSHCAGEPIALLDLPATWDEYLARLTRHARHELRRRRRRFVRALGDGHLRTADAETLPHDLDTFFALFRRARGEKGGFMSPSMERFFRDIASAFLPLGMLRLDVLEAGGRAVAVAFGFRTRSVYYLYNMAFDPDVQAASPGAMLVGTLVEQAIRDELARFDFMRGLERYKFEFGASRADLRRLRVRAD
jgi:CelD/BcsL family acetyltransferase involved in cellulose biosynthesis